MYNPALDEVPSGERERWRPRSVWWWVGGGVVLWWVGLAVPLVVFAAIGVSVTAVVKSARQRRWVALAVTLIAIPPTVFSGASVVAYARGSARLMTIGLPHITMNNVDPETRYQTWSTGCVVDGTEWIELWPTNGTLRALQWLLGPMPGAYDGPYPTEAEIARALTGAESPHPSALVAGRLEIGSAQATLQPTVAKMLRETDAKSDLRGTIWRERVAILQVRPKLDGAQADPTIADAQPTALILIDGESGRILAYDGAVSHLAPGLPMPWR